MFPKIPENWQSLSSADLRELAAEIKTAFAELGDDIDAETRKAALAAVEGRPALLELAAEKERIAAAKAALEGEADDETDDESDETELGDESDDESDEGESDEGDGEGDEGEDLSAKVPVRKSGTSTDLGAKAEATSAAAAIRPDQILAHGGVTERKGGEQFQSWGDLASSLVSVAETLSPGATSKVPVAYIKGNFSEAQQLGPNMVQNLKRFDTEELQAAFCAPATPIYDMACWNTDRRPVRGSLPQFRPDQRGSVSIFPSPSLSDITDQSPAGVGIWDTDDDDTIGTTDPSSKECATITCGTPTVYSLYGVWRCLTIQNLLAMTFPELVEAWLNRLGAAHSRLAETQLLEAMGTEAVPVTGDVLGYGAATSVTSQVLEVIALHQEQERWDGDQMEAWLPRWVRSAMKMDIMRRRNDSGRSTMVTDAEIDTMFRNVGLMPHFFIDTPTWAAAVPAVQTGGNKNNLPSTIDMLIAPRGKFAVMDRGQLNIGVTGNNIYRDNASNASNQFTMFWENFEGVVNTDSCPAYLLEFPSLCYNGVQIADVEIDCDGAAAA
jgi:hypothetical protein